MKDLRNRHLDFYLDLTAQAEAEGDKAQADWAEALEADLDNLRAALSWAFESGQVAKALDLAGTIAPYCFEWWGRWSEGRRWLERALAAANGENHARRAKALAELARLAHMQGDDSTSSSRYREAANAYKETGNDLGAATSLAWLGWNLWYEDRSEEAIPVLEEAVAGLRGLRAARPLALALSGLAWNHLSQGNSEEALRVHEEAIEVLRGAGDRAFLADRLLSQANMYTNVGDRSTGNRIFSEMIAILRELGDKVRLMKMLPWAATNSLMAGSLTEAESMYEEQLHLAAERGDSTEISNARSGLARIAWARGDFEGACKLYTDAISKGYEVGDPSYLDLGLRADDLRELGGLLQSLGRRDEAKRRLLEAVAIGRNSRNPLFKPRQAVALERLARIAEEEGDFERAVALAEEAVDSLREVKESSLIPLLSLAESELLRAKGDDGGALRVLEKALQEAKGSDRRYPLARVHYAIGRLQYEQGKDRDAAALLDEGKSVAENGSLWDVSSYLELLAAATASAGDLDRAFEVLSQLGWRRNLLGKAPRIAETLAKIKVGHGEWQTAARLIGAAEALRGEISSSIPEWERAAHESCAAKVREALGPMDFEKAVIQGRESGAAREIEEALK